MGKDRLHKLMMNWQPDGKNWTGRPKERWRDNLREGLERYGLRGIENNGRREWRRLSVEENCSGEIHEEEEMNKKVIHNWTKIFKYYTNNIWFSVPNYN